DLQDAPEDEEKMKTETVILDLPDVSDIPGQENIHVPPLGELADTTISSDDEEGVGLFDDEELQESDIIMGNDSDVSTVEKKQLEAADEDMPTEDETGLRMASLDQEDEEGDLLNEGSSASSISGADLDISGADSDDPNESIGEEDEENNHYSLGGDEKEEEGAETS
ncbi:MAG TPA: hypothetical protein VEZ17_05850, partial [Chitinophagaceae bacterium]|nr:hypothetical protein [Chitinophagaceae bacterium]